MSKITITYKFENYNLFSDSKRMNFTRDVPIGFPIPRIGDYIELDGIQFPVKQVEHFIPEYNKADEFFATVIIYLFR